MTIFLDLEPSPYIKPVAKQRTRRPSPWKIKERVEKLKQLVSENHSAAVIANILGCFQNYPDGGRCSVLGKIFREKLGMTRTSAVKQRYNGGQKRNSPRKPPTRAVGPIVKPEPIVEISDQDIPLSQRVDFMGLTNLTCRWPCGMPGEADFFFCGALEADNVAGVVYCRMHARRGIGRTYNAAEKRQFYANQLSR